MDELDWYYDDDFGGIEGDFDFIEDPGDPAGEVGRLLSKKKRRRLRRFFGATLGGPLGWAVMAGKHRRRKRGRRRARQAARALAAVAPTFAEPRPDYPVTDGHRIIAGSQRQVPLGLGVTTVTAGSIATLSATVQRAFQPEKLVVSSAGIADLNVLEILIGVRNQLAGTEELPAELFDARAVGTSMLWDPAGPGVDVTLRIGNGGTTDHVVTAALLGSASN